MVHECECKICIQYTTNYQLDVWGGEWWRVEVEGGAENDTNTNSSINKPTATVSSNDNLKTTT